MPLSIASDLADHKTPWGSNLRAILLSFLNDDASLKGAPGIYPGQFVIAPGVNGIAGDGITNDTLAIQAVIDAASAAATAIGGNARAQVYWYGPFKYLLTYSQQRGAALAWNALQMKSNIELTGIGMPWFYANQVGQHVPGQIFKTMIGDAGTAINNFAIKGLLLDGGFVANQQSAGRAFPDATEDFFGISLGNGNANFEIADCSFKGIWGDVIRLGDGGSAANFRLHDLYMTIMNGQCFSIHQASDFEISNVIGYDSQASGGGGTEAIIVGSDSDVTEAGIVHQCIFDKMGLVAIYGQEANSFDILYDSLIVRPIDGGFDGMILDGTNNALNNCTVDLAKYSADAHSAIMCGILSQHAISPRLTNNTVIVSPGGSRINAGQGINNTAPGAVISGNEVNSSSVGTPDAFQPIRSSGAGCDIGPNGGNTGQASSISGAGTVARGNRGFNPVGNVTVAVPATTVATAATVYDRIFYVTAAAGGSVSCVVNGTTILVPASAVVAITVLAGETLTPTYTSAPTWTVQGR